jgi:hypothetical protein
VRRRSVTTGAVLIIALGVALLACLPPAIAALGCPLCFGMERLSGEGFVESARSAPERARLLAMMAEGDRKVAGF